MLSKNILAASHADKYICSNLENYENGPVAAARVLIREKRKKKRRKKSDPVSNQPFKLYGNNSGGMLMQHN